MAPRGIPDITLSEVITWESLPPGLDGCLAKTVTDNPSSAQLLYIDLADRRLAEKWDHFQNEQAGNEIGRQA